MIDRDLNPLDFVVATNRPLTLETFALTYLASYSDQAIQPRVMTAFNRAYGPNVIKKWAPVNNGRPGFVLARWNQLGRKRMTIAIEGSRSWMQNLNWQTLNLHLTETRLPGYVYGPFLTYALEILALLQGDPDFGQGMLQTEINVIVAGHSLGAAVADILSRLIRAEYSPDWCKLVKFASPRVGNRDYAVENRGYWAFESWYCDRDPIDIFPIPHRLPWTTPTISSQRWISFDRDVTAFRLDIHASRTLDSFYERGYSTAAQYARYATQTMARQNPWWDHQIKAYRYLFTCMASFEEDSNHYRFRYLEFNDENKWGLEFVRGEFITDAMLELVSPDPAPVDVGQFQVRWADLQAGYRQVIDAWNARPTIEPPAPPPPEPPQPVVTPVREMIRVAPATFTPTANGRRRGR